jgi:hypothetical protein
MSSGIVARLDAAPPTGEESAISVARALTAAPVRDVSSEQAR